MSFNRNQLAPARREGQTGPALQAPAGAETVMATLPTATAAVSVAGQQPAPDRPPPRSAAARRPRRNRCSRGSLRPASTALVDRMAARDAHPLHGGTQPGDRARVWSCGRGEVAIGEADPPGRQVADPLPGDDHRLPTVATGRATPASTLTAGQRGRRAKRQRFVMYQHFCTPLCEVSGIGDEGQSVTRPAAGAPDVRAKQAPPLRRPQCASTERPLFIDQSAKCGSQGRGP